MDKYARRLIKVQRLMRQSGLDYLFLSPAADMYYLTGLKTVADERLQIAVVPAGGNLTLVLPEMYRGVAAAGGSKNLNLVTWADQVDPYSLIKQAVCKAGGRAAVDEGMRAGHLLGLMQALADFQFQSANTVMLRSRLCKEKAELVLLQRASRLADRVMAEVAARIRPAMAERELAWFIEMRLRELGAQDISFRPIVAAGPNAASPHHVSGDRRFARGDFIVVDFGAVLAGYSSDITRTFSLGAATAEMKQVYRAVQEANEAAFRAAAAGIPCAEVDGAARRVIAGAGYGEYFCHRTGHGIGLDVHEEPYLVEGNGEVLAPGMVFSVEPGIYVPGKFGVRVEDIVALTEKGPRRLNNVSRELLEI